MVNIIIALAQEYWRELLIVVLTLMFLGVIIFMRQFIGLKIWSSIRHMPILILQSPTMAKFIVPKKRNQNWYEGDEGVHIIAPPQTIKASNIGIAVGVGDMFTGLLVNEDILALYNKKRNSGMSIEQFDSFIQDIADDKIGAKNEYDYSSLTLNTEDKQNKRMITVYRLLDYSKTKEFVSTGLNMAWLTIQKECGIAIERAKAGKQPNWMNYAMAIAVLGTILIMAYLMINGSASPSSIPVAGQIGSGALTGGAAIKP